ncbi:MAG: kinase/pyrophosphorylase, partial [Cellulomonadaceae bacterium]
MNTSSRDTGAPGRASTAEPVPVFFLSDSTGITAQALGTALLVQFPDLRFARQTFPFIRSVDEARRIVRTIDEAAASAPGTLVFS